MTNHFNLDSDNITLNPSLLTGALVGKLKLTTYNDVQLYTQTRFVPDQKFEFYFEMRNMFDRVR